MKCKFCLPIITVALVRYIPLLGCLSFTSCYYIPAIKFQQTIRNASSSSISNEGSNDKKKRKDNKAMAFLKKMGRVGGIANRDYTNVIGIDEGPAGKHAGDRQGLKKARQAFKPCTESGIIDTMEESFPLTSSGTQWSGFTDQVMGGKSSCILTREKFQGRSCNVLRGHVSLENNGGFVQMATNLMSDPTAESVDASSFDGVELDVSCETGSDYESFNVHLKTEDCVRPFSSYRSSFDANVGWNTVRVPFNSFKGHGPGAIENPFDLTRLKRAGIVAIGKEADVALGVSGFRFYKNRLIP